MRLIKRVLNRALLSFLALWAIALTVTTGSLTRAEAGSLILRHPGQDPGYVRAAQEGERLLAERLATLFAVEPIEGRARLWFMGTPRGVFVAGPQFGWRPDKQPFAFAYGALDLVAFGPVDLDRGVILRGKSEVQTRPLISVIAHELAHIEFRRRFGGLAQRRAQTWAEEGLAERLSGGGTLPLEMVRADMCDGKAPTTPAEHYGRYHLAVHYLIEVEHAGFEAIFKSPEPFDAILSRAVPALCSGALPLPT